MRALYLWSCLGVPALSIALPGLGGRAFAGATPSAASAFATAYIDQKVYGHLFDQILNSRLSECVASGKIDPQRQAMLRPRIAAYVSNLTAGLVDVQSRIAEYFGGSFAPQELTQLTAFFRSASGQHMIVNGASALAQPIASSVAICDLPVVSITPQQSVTAIRESLSTNDMAQIRVFAQTPVARKFTAAGPAFMPILASAFRSTATNAARKAGF